MPKDKKPVPSVLKAKFRKVAPQPVLPLVPTKMLPTMRKPSSESVHVPTVQEQPSMIEKTVREPEDKPVTKIIGKKKVRLPKKKKQTE